MEISFNQTSPTKDFNKSTKLQIIHNYKQLAKP